MCGSCTIVMRVLYKNDIAIYFYIKYAKNNYFPFPAKFKMYFQVALS
jgi:hypothetical protein